MGLSRLKIDLAFGAALVLLGLAALLSFRSVQKLRTSASSVVHTERVLREIAALTAEVMEAETTQRGFLLTREPIFRERYDTARASVEESLLTLQSLVSDNPEQTRRVDDLGHLVELRMERLHQVLRQADGGDVSGAAQAVWTGGGQQLADSIAVLARRLTEREFALLEERRTTESATAGGTILFVLLGSVGAILIVATSRQSLLHQLRRREVAEQALEINERYMGKLYSVAAHQGLSYPQRLQAIVALGASRYGAELGILARRRNGAVQLIAVHDPDGSLRPGTTLAADDPCVEPIVNAAGRFEPPADGSGCFGGRAFRVGLSMPFRIAGEEGYIAFLDTRVDHDGFNDADRDFLGVLAQWAAVEMERYGVRKELEEREERYRGLVENANDLIYLTDAEGRFIYVNPIAATTVGYSTESLEGMPSIDLVREDAREEMRRRLREQVREKTANVYYEVPVITRDEREIWLGQHLQLLTAGDEVIGLQAVARDITRQLEMERMKDDFLSVVSHELRTPLTSIRGSLGLLASGRMGTLQPQGQRMLDIAAQNTDRLVRLINDLLDIDKIESGKAPLQPVRTELSAVVESAAELMQPLADRSEVTLEVTTVPVTVSVDPDRIVQLLTNLISNAIKFSEAGDTVRVRMALAEREVRITVSDEGRGIPADKLESIFERFQQVDSSDSRRKGGTGLGLAIVRRIAEQHGGAVWAESEWGEGSTFHLTLPAERTAPALPVAPPEAGSEPAGRESYDILIVEDDLDLAKVICETLEGRGLTLRHARDGEEALELSRRISYRLLLLDPGLPGMDGFALVGHLRGGRHADVPMVVYTTRSLTAAEREALRLGRTVYLTKTRHPLEALEAAVIGSLGESEAHPSGV